MFAGLAGVLDCTSVGICASDLIWRKILSKQTHEDNEPAVWLISALCCSGGGASGELTTNHSHSEVGFDYISIPFPFSLFVWCQWLKYTQDMSLVYFWTGKSVSVNSSFSFICIALITIIIVSKHYCITVTFKHIKVIRYRNFITNNFN